jgi:diguanylate cyclase (GGDEF)-like protein
MLFVLILDAIAYLMAVNSVSHEHSVLVSVLADIFVAVALLTITVGLVLPGMITYSAQEVSAAAKRLTWGTLRDFTLAMQALGRGDLQAAHASVNIVPVKTNSRDELGEMAASFNLLQEQMKDAALGLDEARENMRTARAELLERHEQIAHLAHHDGLTDLPNRNSLNSRLAQALERAKARGETFAVLSIDLDHFKEANDVFGHMVGDDLLCAVARRLEIAADGALVSRVGGDEFTLVSLMGPQPRTAEVLASRVLQAVADPFEVRGQKIPLGLSIGAAVYPRDGADMATLLANADAALYRAKVDGRQTARFFDPEMDRRLRERFALQLDLRSAIARDELFLN